MGARTLSRRPVNGTIAVGGQWRQCSAWAVAYYMRRHHPGRRFRIIVDEDNAMLLLSADADVTRPKTRKFATWIYLTVRDFESAIERAREASDT